MRFDLEFFSIVHFKLIFVWIIRNTISTSNNAYIIFNNQYYMYSVHTEYFKLFRISFLIFFALKLQFVKIFMLDSRLLKFTKRKLKHSRYTDLHDPPYWILIYLSTIFFNYWDWPSCHFAEYLSHCVSFDILIWHFNTFDYTIQQYYSTVFNRVGYCICFEYWLHNITYLLILNGLHKPISGPDAWTSTWDLFLSISSVL